MNRTIYFGPPGTGKTTTLLRRLEEHLAQGTPPDRIAFLTFTRRARREALERVEALGYTAKDLPHFRTIHSMAYRGLELHDGDVMGLKELDVFGTAMGLSFGRKAVTEIAAEGIASQSEGDAMLAMDTLARLSGASLREVFDRANIGLGWPAVEFFSASYVKYKRDTGLLDFTDVLLEFVRAKIELPIDVAFIDEAQDLSALQWLAALQAVVTAHTQYVAGDDDQAIYKWAGADVETFLKLEGTRVVLNQSYRLPRSVHAMAQSIAKRIKHRVEKEFAPRDADGRVVTHMLVDTLKVEPKQQWLWLVRNVFLLMRLHNLLQLRGIVFTQQGVASIVESHRDAIYTWERLRRGRAVPVEQCRDLYKLLKSKEQIAHGHKLLPRVAEDAALTMSELREHHGLLAKDGTWFEVLHAIPYEKREYYRRLLRAHESLKLESQVQLETIHGAKGAQAEYVALFLEQSRRVSIEAQRREFSDEEHRVWYVGVTRARSELHIVLPTGPFSYDAPQPVN